MVASQEEGRCADVRPEEAFVEAGGAGCFLSLPQG